MRLLVRRTFKTSLEPAETYNLSAEFQIAILTDGNAISLPSVQWSRTAIPNHH